MLIKNFKWLMIGKWWRIIQFNQIYLFEILKLKKQNLPAQCFFDNSINSYKPLWSYVFEKYKKDVFMFYYSTNLENIKFKSEINTLEHNYFHLHSWQNYIVWDLYQKEYIKKYIKIDSNFIIAGYIDFYDLIPFNPIPKKKYIAVFDVSPFREFYLSNICNNNQYYNYINIRKLILDIYNIANDLNIEIYHKPKKIIDKGYKSFFKTNKKYIKFINELKTKKNYKFIPPSYSSYDVIIKSSLVISIPYTSTSLIAKLNNIKCIYYDPTGKLLENHKISHGIKLINNYDLLKKYIIKSFL